jgi:DNA ligase-1
MKSKIFKPMLAPNDEKNIEEIKYPILASYKLDGIRCLFIKGEMLSRSLKPIQNKQLKEKFKSLIDYSREHNLILDGEIYSPELTFQEITRYVMTQDFTDKKSIKKYGKVLTIPKSLKFYGFDIVWNNNFNERFIDRIGGVSTDIDLELWEAVSQITMNNKEDIEEYFETALKNGYEGLILKDPNGRYKCGRGTIKEGLIYKVKPYKTFDAKIIGVIQATKVDPKAEKKINELGRSVTSKKLGDRLLINKASAFEVFYNDKILKVTLAMTDEEKETIWAKRSTYIGKIIEYKGMLIGSKDVPRHPVMIRFREDKNEYK